MKVCFLKNEKVTVAQNVPISQGIISEERICQLTGNTFFPFSFVWCWKIQVQ